MGGGTVEQSKTRHTTNNPKSPEQGARPVAWKPDTSDTSATSRSVKEKKKEKKKKKKGKEEERNGSSLMRVDTSAGVLVGPFALRLSPPSNLVGDEVFSGTGEPFK
ncbi:hypothetical protein PUN28_008433 [Cardiocondyla obscurior]|uniref:Uncharacterized protein n=1 Tax=Cardiocondyla obscurior TaxID=286306 RepID=A0AAW2G3Z0_9HYME